MLGLLLVLCSCASTSFEAGVYRDREAHYRVGQLDGRWQRIAIRDNDLAWRNEELGAIVQVNASCDPARDVPLAALTQHLLIGFTARSTSTQTLIDLDGREALRSELTAKLDGVPRHLVFYVLKKNECVYDFALIGPDDEQAASAASTFDAFVRTFATIEDAP